MFRLFQKARDDTEALIRRLIRNAEPLLRARFLTAIAAMKDEVDLEAVAELLATGRVAEALAFSERHIERAAIGLGQVYTSSGEATATWIGAQLSITVDFDTTNELAVRIMREEKLRFIREFTQQQLAATRTALINGIQAGDNPRVMARVFRDSLGLTEYQLNVVENYRRLLEEGSKQALDRKLRDKRFDRTVLNAVDGDALSTAQIERMTERYRERMLRYRSEVIARTEALRAVHTGSEEMFRQAIERGDLSPHTLSRRWNTASDDRVRDTHASMSGQTVSYGQDFITGAGVSIRYPGDASAPASETIQCRCAVSTRIVR